ncbi:FtsW/RodA/SpoVE family cell cycle protein [candidate division KSB1 bacterium]|nr:FtsW/RodA/SpoVE family cell cycle protein [candidate division KSB1 bacterium]
MREQNLKLDSALFLIVLILLVVGVVMVYSASSFKAQEIYEDSHYFLKNHFYKVLFGLILMLLVSKIDYTVWLKISPLILLVSFGALIYLLVSPDVVAVRGSKRWIQLGSFQFQPADLAKLALILFLSHSLGRTNLMRTDTSKRFIFHLGVIALIILPIVLQPDAGTAILISFIVITLVFVSGEKLRHFFFPAITPLVFLLIIFLQKGYQWDRIIRFFASLKGEEMHWQTQQSFISLGNGGFFGLGLGGSRQKYHFLPDPFTDFIYAIVGEEMGILGTLAILILLIAFVSIGVKIAMMTVEKPGKLLAFGIVLNIAIYAFTNSAVVLNLLPTTGIPMPFLSYGGSALIINLFGIGILLNIAEQNRRKLSRLGNYSGYR